jgi:beta-galactosidase
MFLSKIFISIFLFFVLCNFQLKGQDLLSNGTNNFNKDWKFFAGEVARATEDNFNDAGWRKLDLPHDAGIEGTFNVNNSSKAQGAFLPTILGYYRKTFKIADTNINKSIYIDFDGVYRNSEIWINGYYLGKRPNGYVSFRYDLSTHLYFGNKENVLLVKVDNFAQPGSRWYTGSGIYRNVWLTIKNKININQWGVQILSNVTSSTKSILRIKTSIHNDGEAKSKLIIVKNVVYNRNKVRIAESNDLINISLVDTEVEQTVSINKTHLWSINDPYLYTVVTQIVLAGKIIDEYKTPYGIRYFRFDNNGFFLNSEKVKIKGVCNHHDLGCLGAAINTSAIKRQLSILKNMGCNAIRTAHNPPAPELLNLCDEMGFIVMDEAFDVWKMPKTPFDYHWNWDEWHKRDLEDQIKRDRNHASVFIWSIGNEIPEQLGDANGNIIAKQLKNIIRSLDTSRPVTAGNNHPYKENKIIQSGALDIIGCNYHDAEWSGFPSYYPGQKFIATETVSALQTRGEYSFPSDKIIQWRNEQIPFGKSNIDFTCSAYDNEISSWGSTHEQTLINFKKFDFVSGMFVWSGFDYLGEPTPYYWPARSSYFGIVDLAGFPKDVYYLYQSEWTKKPVLHLFPHWNWKNQETVDVWAYYNNADEVELYLNEKSLGKRKKQNEMLHVMWRVNFIAGTIKAVSRKNGKVILVKEITTAGKADRILLEADKKLVRLNEKELAFVTVKIVDVQGNIVPHADNLISFELKGNAFIAGVDNGNPISHEPFKANQRKAFNGLALVVVQPDKKTGDITLTAHSDQLKSSSLNFKSY